MAETTIKLQPGDILYSSWGYEQTNIDFYRVIKLCGKTMVKLEKIGKLYSTEQYSEYTDSVLPDPRNSKSKSFRRKVYNYTRPGVMVNSYQWAAKWDGLPKAQTNAYYGH